MLVLQEVDERREGDANVVENLVEYHPDAATVHVVGQLDEFVIRTEFRVDLVEVSRIVAVVAVRLHHGIDVDRVHSQTLKIRHTAANPRDVASVAVRVRWLRRPRSFVLGVVLGAGVVESIREDLIEHGSFDPSRHFKRFVRHRIDLELVSFGLGGKPLRANDLESLSVDQGKTVMERRFLIPYDAHAVKIEQLVPANPFHRSVLALGS